MQSVKIATKTCGSINI